MNSSAQAGIEAEPRESAVADPALLEQAKTLWDAARGLTHSHLQLAALETRLAGQSLVTMIVAGVVAGILLVSAWLGLCGIGVLLLVGSGVIASVAISAVVAFNLVFAFILYIFIRRKSRDLRFPATVRSLRPGPTAPQGIRVAK